MLGFLWGGINSWSYNFWFIGHQTMDKVQKYTSIVYFILHIAHTVDACALTSILPLLFLIDMIYFMADTKVTPESLQGVGVDF
jgi:hypothetical protein